MKTLKLFSVSILVILLFHSLTSQAQELKRLEKFFKTEYYKGDEHITKDAFVSQLETNEKAFKHWKKARTYNTLSGVALGAELGFAIWRFSDLESSTARAGVFGSFGAVVLFSVVGMIHDKKAVKEYNSALNKKVSFSPSKKGFGIVMQF